MSEQIINFELPKISPSIIMVTGVGGGGSNAVNHMFDLGIAEVSFMVCNTDRQALYRSPVPIKVRLGETLTQGLGAGNNPERGREAALESLDEITEIYKREGVRMVFITAGMGGGTGTGAAPVIAQAARELGILTVAIVTLPFKTEGKKRMEHAYQGVEELRKYVDSLLLINNENIQEIYGKLTLTEAFGKADDVLATAARSIAEIITHEYRVNVDFADVQTVMSNSGVALMGSGRANGEQRAIDVANAALASPLLNHNDIVGAKDILINITSGDQEITMEETYLITEYIQERAGNNADIIWGAGFDSTLGDDIEVTIIATGFDIASMPHLFCHTPRSSAYQIVAAEMGADGADSAVAAEEQTEDVVVEPRRRWVPPTENGTVRQGFNRPSLTPRPLGGRAEDQTAESTESKPYTHPTPPAPPQPQVIASTRTESEVNIDELESVPAFVRRQMRFSNDKPEEGARGARVVLKDDVPAPGKPAEQNSSLFD